MWVRSPETTLSSRLLVSEAMTEDRSGSLISVSLRLEVAVALTILSSCFGRRDSVPPIVGPTVPTSLPSPVVGTGLHGVPDRHLVPMCWMWVLVRVPATVPPAPHVWGLDEGPGFSKSPALGRGCDPSAPARLPRLRRDRRLGAARRPVPVGAGTAEGFPLFRFSFCKESFTSKLPRGFLPGTRHLCAVPHDAVQAAPGDDGWTPICQGHLGGRGSD